MSRFTDALDRREAARAREILAEQQAREDQRRKAREADASAPETKPAS
jgi:hypothetical protein